MKKITQDRKTKMVIIVLRQMIINYDMSKNKDLAKGFGRIEYHRMKKRQHRNIELIEQAATMTYDLFDDYVRLAKIK